MAAKELYKPITLLINLSKRKTQFKSRWNIREVVPLHKGKTCVITVCNLQINLKGHSTPTGKCHGNHKSVPSEPPWVQDQPQHHYTTTALLQLADTIFVAT